MAHIPNQYNNVPGHQTSMPGPFPQHNQIPPSQVPGPVKQDGNFNPASIAAMNSQTNHFNQSTNSSPAFNHPGMLPPPLTSLQSSPMRPMKTTVTQNQLQNIQNIPVNSGSPHPSNPSPFPPNIQRPQINNNAPPLISSSQYNQPFMNGPTTGPIGNVNHYPPNSSSFSPIPPTNLPPTSSNYGPSSLNSNYGGNQRLPMSSMPPGYSQPNVPISGPPISGPPLTGLRNSPVTTGPPGNLPMTNVPNISGPPVPPLGPPRSNAINGPTMMGLSTASVHSQMGPPKGLPSGPSSLPAGPQLRQPMPPNINPPQHQLNNGPLEQQGYIAGPPNMPAGKPGLQSGPVSGPPMSHSGPGPASGISGQNTNIQNRYPPMPYTNLSPQQQMQVQQNIAKQFPTHNLYGVTQQMSNLSVTKQGFDQLWGHQMVDLMQCKNILPEYLEEPPEIKLAHQFAESPNCSSEIFRCTVNRIPESNSLLQKSRLPLGILIHPFKDLNHLPVIQCTTIVRCRACRTYINPFVYFVDSKRWKCNLCYRVNDLPEEFQYDPLSKSYGDPSRRPEIKSATIEFIAPSEYMLRPPQPAVYLFLLDVSQIARESGYLQVVCETLKTNLEQLPGDARTQIGFICYDAHVHYYLMSEGLTRPKEMTVLDIDEIFLPSPESLLVNLGEYKDMVKELLTILPQRYSTPGVPASALGAALQAAYKLMAPTGGRITVFQTCLPNIGPGGLHSREDPNARSSKDVAHLNPATDFFKRIALDCSGAQVAVDLFLLSSQYCDLATLSGMSKFSAGTVYHIPLFRAQRPWQAEQLTQMFTRYLTRKIGFEAVMRVRCTRGISIHTFHGNFFVRSTDLLSLPNVSPDAGFGMQLTIEESLSDLQQVCFQAALLYTSSKGERRIRVHTLALPIANTLPDILHAADQQCIIGLLSKMAVDRCVSASMSEAKEALINAAVDMLSAHRLAQNLPAGAAAAALHAPAPLRLLPLYVLALLKRKAFRTGTSTRLDERVADMCLMKCAPLPALLRVVHPDLYALHALPAHAHAHADAPPPPLPPRLQLSAERISMNGAYLLDDGETMIIYVCHGVSPAFLSETFGVAAFSQLPDEARSLPKVESEGNEQLHALIEKLNDDRPYPASILILRDNSPSRQLFTERLIEDRVESAFSYYEFLQHIKTQVK
nr:protein transport protein Sec24A [Vanessa tameamea]XP_026485760.1 protein transport protein Sec24A [Vanessa tameamea]